MAWVAFLLLALLRRCGPESTAAPQIQPRAEQPDPEIERRDGGVVWVAKEDEEEEERKEEEKKE